MSRDAYAALLRAVRAIRWPQVYHSDLFQHDRQRLLAPDAPGEFCWSVRSSGTWFYAGHPGDLWRLLYWELRCMWDSRFFHWNGEHLRECSFSEAILLVEALEARHNKGMLSAEARSSAPLALLRREARAKEQGGRNMYGSFTLLCSENNRFS